MQYPVQGGGQGDGGCSRGGQGCSGPNENQMQITASRGRVNYTNPGAKHSFYQGGALTQRMPYAGQHIPYIPAQYQPNQQAPPVPKFSNIVKDYANTNVSFTHGFDVEDWHTSATCTTTRNLAIKRDSHVQTSWRTSMQTTNSVARQCKRQCILPASDGGGQ